MRSLRKEVGLKEKHQHHKNETINSEPKYGRKVLKILYIFSSFSKTVLVFQVSS